MAARLGEGMTFFVHWTSGTVPLPLRKGRGPLSFQDFLSSLADSQSLVEDSKDAVEIAHFEFEDEDGDRTAVQSPDEFLSMLDQVVSNPVVHIYPVAVETSELQKMGRALNLRVQTDSAVSQPTPAITSNSNEEEIAFDSEVAFHDLLNRSRLRQESIQNLALLGNGHCSTVYKAVDNESGRLLAVKYVSLDVCQDIQAQILMELEILQKCSSPFVVEFHGALLFESLASIAIVMEFMDAGSLGDHGAAPPSALLPIAAAVVLGLDYIWSLKIMHRDIKPSNILLNHDGAVKLCDFGVSTQLEKSIAESYVGTNAYMAPERILGGDYRVHSDVWSLGVTLLEAALGRFPFGDVAPGKTPVNDVMVEMFRRSEPVDLSFDALDACPSEFRDFLTRCLICAPASRISPVELKQHPLVVKNTPFDSSAVQSWLSSTKTQDGLRPIAAIKGRFVRIWQWRPERQTGGRAFLAIDSLTPQVFAAVGTTLRWIHASDEVKSSCLAPEYCDEGDSVEVLEYLSDQLLLVVVLHSGNIVTYDPGVELVESAGKVEAGVDGGGWSPDLELAVLVSPRSTLYILNRELDVVAELKGDPERAGEDGLMTVGWGKKETQFHGSAGKQAALLDSREQESLNPSDTGRAVVSWRGDGLFFAVSSISKVFGLRKIRIWTREGVHSCTLEPTKTMQPFFRASGMVACSAQRKKELEIIFFEKNGLRHGGFSARLPRGNMQTLEVGWNADSSILAVWNANLEQTEMTLSLWTVSNYHWGCKYTIKSEVGGAISAFKWDPEDSSALHVLFSSGECRRYRFHRSVDSGSSPSSPVCVVDGQEVRVSFFGKAVIPPPMASMTLNSARLPVNEVFLSRNCDRVAGFCGQRTILVWSLTEESGPNEYHFDSSADQLWSWIWTSEHTVAALCCSGPIYSLCSFRFGESGVLHEICSVLLESSAVAAISWLENVAVHFSDGSWEYFSSSGDGQMLEPMAAGCPKYRCACPKVALLLIGEKVCSVMKAIRAMEEKSAYFENALVGLSPRHQLFVNEREVATDVTSFAVHTHFLLLTTMAHRLLAVPITHLLNEDLSLEKYEARNVERGSELIVAVSGTTRVILQMPRGNLEVIHPRPITLFTLHGLLEKCQYHSAFMLMKHQRINLNLLFDHNPRRFFQDVGQIVEDVGDSTLLNMFLLELMNSDVCVGMYAGSYPRVQEPDTELFRSKVNDVCEEFKKTLLASAAWKRRHFTVVLTTFVKSSPMQLDQALLFLKELMRTDESIVDEAVRHLLYLVEGEELYRMALATYDFDLVLIVAERSQKDPKEFLPFLNELRRLDDNYRKFSIENYLGRYSKALVHLHRCGDSKFSECLAFIKKHGLFDQGLQLFPREGQEYQELCGMYGEHLVSKGQLTEGLLFFRWARQLPRALEVAVRGGEWQEALQLISELKLPEPDRERTLRTMAHLLLERRRFSPAAYILSALLNDEAEATRCYCSGEQWMDALRVANFDLQNSLVEEIISPRLETLLSERTAECRKLSATLESYCSRLETVRELKRKKWEALANEDPDLPDADLYSETTTTLSQMTTTTAAGGIRRRDRNAARKKRSLKEGSRFEDFGLMNAIRDAFAQADLFRGQLPETLHAAVRMGLGSTARELNEAASNLIDFCQLKACIVWPDTWSPHMLPGPPEQSFHAPGEGDGAALPQFGTDTRLTVDPILQRPVMKPWPSSSFAFLKHL